MCRILRCPWRRHFDDNNISQMGQGKPTFFLQRAVVEGVGLISELVVVVEPGLEVPLPADVRPIPVSTKPQVDDV